MARLLINSSFFILTILLSLVLIGKSLALGDDVKEAKLIETGSFHGDEVSAKTGEEWFAILKVGSDYMIKKTKINVSPVFDPIMDEDESKKTGKVVSIEGNTEPLALLKDIEGIKQGKLNSVQDLLGVIKPVEKKSFRFDGKDFELSVEAKEVTEDSGYKYFKNYKLSVQSEGKKVVILEMPHTDLDAGLPSVIWAGDINNDGGLDLLMSTSNHYNIMETTLFISENGILDKQAIVFRTVGC